MEVADDAAEFALAGGLGHVPVTFTGLTAPNGYELWVDGKVLDQSVHGGDFWQTDYDPARGSWSRTYNVPAGAGSVWVLRRVAAARRN